MVLLGLPWIVMIFTVVGVATNAFAIQFVLFNSFQGFFLFFFFVLISRDAREAWMELVLACYQVKARTCYSAKHSLPSTDKNSKVTYEKVMNTASAQTNDESMFVDDDTLVNVVDDNVETDAQLPSLFNANENTFENQKSTVSNTPEMHTKEEHTSW